MSNKPKHSKTNITKISAKPANAKPANAKPANAKSADTESTEIKPTDVTSADTSTPEQKPTKAKAKKNQQKSRKLRKQSDKAAKDTTAKPLKEVFLLARPFVAFGRYLRDSWREIRQVRWPGRKLTWKMTFAVLVYCAIFIVFIVLLDTLFTFIFELLINAK